eukprot:TRINITY_DN5151_c0_g1_i1.p1 TRINITY_DN5151_c0_g1~~TRINITY_DN5151_c0_g1_i1.p1  ORF type:complete len:177 (+),score=38.19 TRINITY_DN5151_c0_g1_i1:38-532(+)
MAGLLRCATRPQSGGWLDEIVDELVRVVKSDSASLCREGVAKVLDWRHTAQPILPRHLTSIITLLRDRSTGPTGWRLPYYVLLWARQSLDGPHGGVNEHHWSAVLSACARGTADKHALHLFELMADEQLARCSDGLRWAAPSAAAECTLVRSMRARSRCGRSGP